MGSRKMVLVKQLEGRNRYADVKNGLVDTERAGMGGKSWESSLDIYALLWGNRQLGEAAA